MFETAERESCQSMTVLATDESRVTCEQRVDSAERELGAFIRAFETLFGPDIASQAAECWIELVESTSPSVTLDAKFWRQITVMAASRMAARYDSCQTTLDSTVVRAQ